MRQQIGNSTDADLLIFFSFVEYVYGVVPRLSLLFDLLDVPIPFLQLVSPQRM